MTGDRIDLHRVGRVAAEVAEIHGRAVEESSRLVAVELNPAEQELMARGLAARSVDELRDAEVLREPPSLASLNWRELSDLTADVLRRAHALLWLRDQLVHRWASRPDATLADVLKIERREFVALIARELRHAGIHDLDELSPPDFMTGE
jgi:hypothetical protein